MKRLLVSWRQHLASVDAVLLVAGVLGLYVYFTFLPGQHPDSAAFSPASPDEVVGQAEAFMAENGFLVTSDLDVEAVQARNAILLDSLQAGYGRRETVRLLRGEARSELPAYYWRLRWSRETAVGAEDIFEVAMTMAGHVFEFESDPDQPPVRQVHRPALIAAMAGAPAQGEEVATPAIAATDSLLARLVRFAPMGLPASAPPSDTLLMTVAALDTALAQGRPFRLDAAVAAALAQYHLRQSAFRAMTFQVDSVRTAARPRLNAARVYLHAAEPLYGQHLRAIVEVASTGLLLDLETDFDTQEDTSVVFLNESGTSVQSSEGLDFSFTSSDFYDLLSVVCYVILVLVCLFAFGRRMRARVVDAQSALRDALWGGFFLAATVFSSVTLPTLHTVPQLWLALLLVAANVIIAAIGGGLVIFLASGAMDSVARAGWGQKITTLTLVRHSIFRNVPVGASMLRGVLLAGVLVGVLTLVLVVLPGARIDFSDQTGAFDHYSLLTKVGGSFFWRAWQGLLVCLVVLLGIGTALYDWRPKAGVVVPGLMAAFVLLQLVPIDVRPLGAHIAFTGIFGLALAVGFWRYDFIAVFFAYLLAALLWDTQAGWLIEGSDAWVDAVLAFMVMGVVAIVGLVGLFSAKGETEVPSFVPGYIRELAREERMKGELELAHQVQASFLPRRMPRVEGLDLAAMCLPAFDVGGDYYDFVELGPRRLGVVVGDVSGKGIQAAFYMTLVKGFWQTLARSIDSPAEVLRRLNELFCENVPRGTFISMIYGVIDAEAQTITFARAGHNPVIVKRSPSQEPELMRPTGMGIGLTRGPRFDETIAEASIQLRPGDVLVFYTDGFSEAMNARKDLYGDERLARRVSDVGQRSANEILRVVSEDVHHFMEAAGRHDDMTMIVVKFYRHAGYAPGEAASGNGEEQAPSTSRN